MDQEVLGPFMKQRDEVLSWLSQINDATDAVLALHEESKSAFDSAKDAEISADLNRVTSRARDLAGRTKAVLDKMKSDKEKLKAERGQHDITYKTFNQHYTITAKSYVNTMREHQAAKAGFRAESKLDEELEKRIDDSPADFMQQELLRDTVANEEVRRTYEEVQSRAQDVEMLARSIQEVHEMFVDFANLVAHQGEQIDSIEVLVEGTKVKVDKGNTELQKAIEYQRKARKRMCCLALCLMVLLGIAAGVLSVVLK